MSSVRVRIEPVASASVLAWARAARETLDVVRARPELGVPDDVVVTFDAYVAMWTVIAENDDPFQWSGEIDVDLLRHLAAHWARLVTLARTDPAGSGLRPAAPEGEDFYNALTAGMLEAVAMEDTEGFSEYFEEVVPAFDEAIGREPAAVRRRVLLVDDNDDIRLLMRLAIERDPYFEICGEAANGVEAVIACSTCPDAVLLDLLMPVMDGFDALPLLRERCPDASIVVFSALESPATRARVMSLGASAFLQKTADARAVLEALAGKHGRWREGGLA